MSAAATTPMASSRRNPPCGFNLTLRGQPLIDLEIRSPSSRIINIPIDPIVNGSFEECYHYVANFLRSSSVDGADPTKCEDASRRLASMVSWWAGSWMFQQQVEVIEAVVGGSNDGDVCAVCLDGLSGRGQISRLPCSHVFHQRCIHRWIGNQKNSCPICRSNILIMDSFN